MTTKLHLTLFVLFAGLLTWLLCFDPEAQGVTPDYKADAAALLAPTAQQSAPADAPEREDLAPPPFQSPQPDIRGGEPGLTVAAWWNDTEPAAGIQVMLTEWGVGGAVLRRQCTDASGIVRFADLATGRYGVVTDRGTYSWTNHRRGGISTVQVTLPAGIDVRGQVLDQKGQAVPDAEVLLVRDERQGSVVIARSAPDGSFRIRGLRPNSLLWAASETAGASLNQRAAPGEPLVLRVPGHAGASLRVTLAGGGAFPPRAWAHLRTLRSNSDIDEQALLGQGRTLFAPAEGGFSFTGCASGPAVLTFGAPGHARIVRRVDLVAGVTTESILEAAVGASLRGRVVDASDKPIPGARVSFGAFGFNPPVVATDRRGQFCFDHLPLGQGTLAARNGSGATTLDVRVELDGTDDVRLVLHTGVTVHGRVVDEHGQAIAGALVRAVPVHEPRGRHPEARTDASGAFALPECPLGRQRVEVFLRPSDALPLRAVQVADPGAAMEIVIPSALHPRGSVVGRCVDREGNPLTATLTLHPVVSPRVGLVAGATAAKAGAFAARNLPAGRYDLTLRYAGGPTLALPQIELAPGAKVDLGTLTEPATGGVAVTLAGDLEDNVSLRLVAGRVSIRLQRQGNVFRSATVPPGRYAIRTSGWVAPISGTLVVEPGRTTTRQIPERQAHEVRFLIQRPPTEGQPLCSLRITGGADAHTCVSTSWQSSYRPVSGHSFLLTPGSYTVVIETADGLSCTSSFQVSNHAIRHECPLH